MIIYISIGIPLAYIMNVTYQKYEINDFAWLSGYLIFSLLIYKFTRKAIKRIMPECLRVGMYGKDINKKGDKEGEI